MRLPEKLQLKILPVIAREQKIYINHINQFHKLVSYSLASNPKTFTHEYKELTLISRGQKKTTMKIQRNKETKHAAEQQPVSTKDIQSDVQWSGNVVAK